MTYAGVKGGNVQFTFKFNYNSHVLYVTIRHSPSGTLALNFVFTSRLKFWLLIKYFHKEVITIISTLNEETFF